MVTITNGVKTFRVTAGAVNLYKSMGFHVVSDDLEGMTMEEDVEYAEEDFEKSTRETNTHKEKENSDNSGMSKEDAIFVEEILEKPLSQWSNEEVKDFVKIMGIDTSGAQKVSQVRGIIKTYLEERSKNA